MNNQVNQHKLKFLGKLLSLNDNIWVTVEDCGVLIVIPYDQSASALSAR